jgi:hypothetical protein
MSYLAGLTLRLAAGAMEFDDEFRQRHAACLAASQQEDGGFPGRDPALAVKLQNNKLTRGLLHRTIQRPQQLEELFSKLYLNRAHGFLQCAPSQTGRLARRTLRRKQSWAALQERPSSNAIITRAR